ncbi:DUF979 domain-containing protein [Streptomyces asiaticus]|uniref:DUF979 domain-containing protein n=1 Tax=Streptomyces asiaticus TaxID=114695 RepID=UPI003F66F647
MINTEWFFWLVGLVFIAMAGQMAFDLSNPKRLGTAAFWGLLGLSFFYSTWVLNKTAPAQPLGVAVLIMVCLGGFGLTGRGALRPLTNEQREASVTRLGNKLFIPALTVPLVAVLCVSLVKYVKIEGMPLLEADHETIIGLGIGAVIALVIAMWLVRERNVSASLHAGRGMLESMGWALLIPQMLSVLGSIFQASGLGDQARKVTQSVLPGDHKYTSIAIYCVGMALLTIVMGNAFAALPVMTAAIGWPVLVQQLHGDPALVVTAGMYAGFCGTLVTPMAANFNLIPATLLEIRDQYGPIKAQSFSAVALLICNMAIISFFAF